MNRDAAKALANDIFDLAQREGGLIKDSLVDLLERSIDDSAVNRELRNENGILYAENLALRSRVGRKEGSKTYYEVRFASLSGAMSSMQYASRVRARAAARHFELCGMLDVRVEEVSR